MCEHGIQDLCSHKYWPKKLNAKPLSFLLQLRQEKTFLQKVILEGTLTQK